MLQWVHATGYTEAFSDIQVFKMARGGSLILFFVLVTIVALVGAQFAPGEWYAALNKPALNPPNWIFGPVWTGLYILMAIAAWLVWRERGAPGRALALSAWLVQLLLNAAWSWLFFGLHRPGWAFAEIVLLFGAIVVTLVLFWRIRTLAGVLMLPYLLWVGFAAYLNFQIWSLNGGGI